MPEGPDNPVIKQLMLDNPDNPVLNTNSPTRSGPFSNIYKASLGGRGVAVKVIRAIVAKDQIEGAEKLLERETALWNSLHHKHILPFLGVFRGEWSDQRILPALVSLWIERGNLLDFLSEKKASPRMRLINEIADGLKHLHDHGIVHGNVRPSNILIDDCGSALLADFELAGINNFLGLSTTASMANIRYMSPEIILSESILIARKSDDVYAFGSVALEIWTGRKPFHDIQTYAEIILALHDGQCSYNAFPVPDSLSDGLCECLDFSPDRRPTMETIHQRVVLSYHHDEGELRTQARL